MAQQLDRRNVLATAIFRRRREPDKVQAFTRTRLAHAEYGTAGHTRVPSVLYTFFTFLLLVRLHSIGFTAAEAVSPPAAVRNSRRAA